MTTTNTTTQRHDKKRVKEFLLHLAAELRVRELVLEGKPVPQKLHDGVAKRRTKFGSDLIPDAGLMTFLACDPGGQDDPQRHAARQAVLGRRRDKLVQVMGVIEMLDDLET
jgi:hypothetical protein